MGGDAWAEYEVEKGGTGTGLSSLFLSSFSQTPSAFPFPFPFSFPFSTFFYLFKNKGGFELDSFGGDGEVFLFSVRRRNLGGRPGGRGAGGKKEERRRDEGEEEREEGERGRE